MSESILSNIEKSDTKEVDVTNIIKIISSLSKNDDLKEIINYTQTKLDERIGNDLERKIKKALKTKYSNIVDLVTFANNLKLVSYKTTKGYDGDECLFTLSLCMCNKSCYFIESESLCPKLIINGSFGKHNEERERLSSMWADYHIVNVPDSSTDIKHLMEERSGQVPKTKRLNVYGSSLVYDSSVHEIQKTFAFDEEEITNKTYVFFGLVPVNENKLKSFLSDLLTIIITRN